MTSPRPIRVNVKTFNENAGTNILLLPGQREPQRLFPQGNGQPACNHKKRASPGNKINKDETQFSGTLEKLGILPS